MANDRISQIEAKFQTRSDQRDDELSELRESLGVLLSRQSNLEAQHGTLTTTVEGIRGIKPTSVIALISPAIAAAVVVGSLGGYVLTQALKPMEAEVANNKATINMVRDEAVRAMTRLQDRQDDVRTRLAKIEGQLPELRSWLSDVDKAGSRKRPSP